MEPSGFFFGAIWLERFGLKRSSLSLISLPSSLPGSLPSSFSQPRALALE
ncbi:MAG: hypothetical protein LBT86_09200 [Deltaproteobacteria bacterium]|nr:hypothetical protein [Deltaproteobacteria bacterium]